MDSEREWSLPVGMIKENFIEEIESWVSREASTLMGGVSEEESQGGEESKGDRWEQRKRKERAGRRQSI